MTPKREKLVEALREGIDPGHPSFFQDCLDSIVTDLEEAERIFKILARTGPIIPIQEVAAINAWLE